MSTPNFPPIPIRMAYESDGSAKSAFLRDIAAITGSAGEQFDRFGKEASASLERALSGTRNKLGALDLGTDQLRANVAAMEARAAAARELAAATSAAAKSEGDFSQQARLAVAAAEALAVQERNAAAAARERLALGLQVQAQLNEQALAARGAASNVVAFAGAQDRLNAASNSSRYGLQNLSYQIGDVATQFALGAPPALIFGAQAGQVAQALGQIGGGGNKLLAFLGGPWGIGLTAAATVLGAVASKADLFGSKLGDAIGKLREAAAATDLARRAQSAFDQTLEGAIERQRKLNDELDRELSTRGQIVRQRADTAQASLTDATAQRAAAFAEVKRLKQQVDEAKSRNQRPFVLQEQLAAAQTRLGDADNLVAAAERSAASARAVVIQQQARESLDPKLASRSRLEGQASDLLAKRRLGIITEAEYGAAFRKIQAGLDALSKTADSATAASRQFGREIDIAGAKAIAQRAGFRVTSAQRTIAEQQRLYDTVRTPQNPVAFPDANAPHVRGNALDIAFGPGVSPKSIRDAFAAEGVRLTKLLRETGHFHIEFSTSGADKAARQIDQLREAGERAASTIAGINDRFSEQPSLANQSAAAVRELDRIIADLEARPVPGSKALIAQAQQARTAALGFADTQISKSIDQANQALAVQLLTVEGRDKEAAILSAINAEQARLGTLTEAQRQRVADQASAEFRINEVIARRRDLQAAYLDATRTVRSELEAILSGNGKLANLPATFRRLQGQVLTEQIFGPAFRGLEKLVRSRTGVDQAIDGLTSETERAGQAAGGLADELTRAIDLIRRATAAEPDPALVAASRLVLDPSTALRGGIPGLVRASAANDNAAPGGGDEILVQGQKVRIPAPGQFSPFELAMRTGQATAGATAAALRDSGIKLSPQAVNALGGAFGGYLYAGPAGGVIGALREIPKFSAGVDKLLGRSGANADALGGAIKGLGTGLAVSGVANALGIKLNGTGSQIGGAIGSFLPIPGGSIIGSIAGGLIGNLFSKAKTGASAIGVNQFGIAGVTGTGGNNAAARDASKGLGGAVSDQLNQIAEALGADLGQFNVAIGSRKDYFRVSASGSISSATKKKPGADVIYDGKDQNAAIAAAVQNAIEDGAITGISAASQAILRSGQDLNRAIQKAVAIESIPKQLKALTNPVGAAVDTLNQQFEKLVASLKEGGATADQFAEAKQLYDLQRAAAIKQASDQVSSSLTNLLDSLTVNNEALSLTDRRAAALAKLNPLETRLRAGDISSFSDFSSAAQTLIGIERQISGSQADFFALVDRITSETSAAVEKQRALADAATASDSPFAGGANDGAAVVGAVNNQTAALLDGLGGQLAAINSNVIALGLRTGTAPGQAIPSFSASYF